MWPFALIAVYCLAIVAVSLAGGWLPHLVRLTHTRMELIMSGVAGLMLGVALWHLLPHAAEVLPLEQVVTWTMVGILTIFFLIRTFHFHQHGPIETPAKSAAAERGDEPHGSGAEAGHDPSTHHDHDQADAHGPERTHGHHHQHHHHDSASETTSHRLSWIGVAVGLAIHTALDGVALAAIVVVEAAGRSEFALVGLGVFLAIVLHKPLDALSITSLMSAGGWSMRASQTVNVAFSLMCPLGAVLFYLGSEELAAHQSTLVGIALAFSAGVFLCISLGDLLPELQFHRHDRVKLSTALLLGVLIAWSVHRVEHKYLHDHSHVESAAGSDPWGHPR